MDNTCPRCSSDLAGFEYEPGSPERYDGISELVCLKTGCGYRRGRGTGRELKEGEVEKRSDLIQALYGKKT